MARTQKYVSSLAAGGGSGDNVGDPWTLVEAGTMAAAGTDINVLKDGVYNWGTYAWQPTVAGTAAAPIRWRGRSVGGSNGDALRGHLPSGFLDTTNMPILGDHGVFATRVQFGAYNIFEGIHFDLYTSDPVPTIYMTQTTGTVRHCCITADNANANGYGAIGGRGTVHDCDIVQAHANGSGLSTNRMFSASRCRVKSGGAGIHGFNNANGNVFSDCVFYDCGLYGVYAGSTTTEDYLHLSNCTFLGLAGSSDGLYIPGTGAGGIIGSGNIIRGFDGYGANIAGAGGYIRMSDTRFLDNALGDWYDTGSDHAQVSIRELTASHDDFVDAAGGDWRLLHTSPALDSTLRGMSRGACDPYASGIMGYGCA